MSYTIRPAERADLPALSALAAAQARRRRALDERLSASPLLIPFLSHAQRLGDVLSWRHHATFVAVCDGTVAGAINLSKIEQHERDQFATYYPRRFASVGLLAAPDEGALNALLARAREQSARWKTPAILVHNPSVDRAAHDMLAACGYRSYYHYALRGHGAPEPATAGELVSAAPAPRERSARRVYEVQRSAPAPAAQAGSAEVTVRRMTRADMDAVVQLGMDSVYYHATLEPTMQVPRDENRKMRKRFEASLNEPQQSTILVAERERRIAGFYSIYVQSIDDSWMPPLFAAGRYGLIAEVAVDRNLRRLGIGHQLFEAAAQWFRERGAQSFWLIYLPANPLSSRFWTSLHFEPVWEVLLSDQA